MRLKKLELFGFKSFGEKISLQFEGNVIALVGPNGCGKSNIVDAILWVLGEQSARSLRAEKMQDLLFAGAFDQPPFNLAEVSLTFTQVPELFPGCPEEITITRRVYREGSSSYLINKKEARLKDIQEIFYGTGIGKNGFFVFEQGKIDEIIHLSPEKRRLMFEESADISRFLHKKKEAQLQLQELSHNLVRLSDIAQEREKKVRSLQKLASKAQSYKEAKAKLELLEKGIFSFKYKINQEKLQKFQEESAHIELKVQEKEFLVERGEKSALQLQENKTAHQKKYQVLRDALYKVESQLQGFKGDFQRNQESAQELLEKQSFIAEEEKKLLLCLEKDRQEKQAKAEKLEEQLKEKEGLHLQYKAQETLFKQVNSQVQLLLHEEKKIQNAQLSQLQEKAQGEKLLQEKVLRQEGVEEALRQVVVKNTNKQKEIEQQKNSEFKQREIVAQLSKEIENEKSLLQEHLQEGKVLKEAHEIAVKAQEKIRTEIALVTARQKALSQLEEENVGFTVGAKEILKEAKRSQSPLYKKVEALHHYLQPKEGEEKKLALALRLYEETLVVHEEESFWAVLTFAQEKKIYDFSLVIASERKNPLQGLYLSCETKLELPFLSNTLMAESLAVALQMKKEKGSVEVVTQDQYFLDRHGVVFLRKEAGVEKSNLLRAAEIQKIDKQVHLLEKKKEESLLQVQELLEKKKGWESIKIEREELIRKKEMHLLKENFYLQKLTEEVKKLQTELLHLEKEEKKLQAQLVKLAEESKEFLQVCQKAEKTYAQLKAAASEIEEKLIHEKKALEEAHRAFKTTESHFHAWNLQCQETRKHWEMVVLKMEENERSKVRLLQQKVDTEKQKSILKEKRAILEKEIARAILEKESSAAHLQVLELEMREEEKESKEIEKKLAVARVDLKKQEKERHAFDLLFSEEKGIAQKLKEELTQKFPTFSPEKENFALTMPLKEAEESALKLRFETENEGVNLSSIEEYAVEEESFSKLSSQLKDLQESKETLEGVIAKLEKDSKKALKATFENIRKNFKKNFTLLFKGGEADLTLTSEDNILESGVEILAQPPGKKMRFLSLLSGGEKCLTSLALLFALFEARQPPFCILDEVDAPLDEANVERFTTLLKEFVPTTDSKGTQFIIVTHNKKTMSVADLLVGVSMEKRGVSKLITLEFDKKAALVKT